MVSSKELLEGKSRRRIYCATPFDRRALAAAKTESRKLFLEVVGG